MPSSSKTSATALGAGDGAWGGLGGGGLGGGGLGEEAEAEASELAVRKVPQSSDANETGEWVRGGE